MVKMHLKVCIVQLDACICFGNNSKSVIAPYKYAIPVAKKTSTGGEIAIPVTNPDKANPAIFIKNKYFATGCRANKPIKTTT